MVELKRPGDQQSDLVFSDEEAAREIVSFVALTWSLVGPTVRYEASLNRELLRMMREGRLTGLVLTGDREIDGEVVQRWAKFGGSHTIPNNPPASTG